MFLTEIISHLDRLILTVRLIPGTLDPSQRSPMARKFDFRADSEWGKVNEQLCTNFFFLCTPRPIQTRASKIHFCVPFFFFSTQKLATFRTFCTSCQSSKIHETYNIDRIGCFLVLFSVKLFYAYREG